MSTIAARSYRIASGDTLVNLEKAVNQALSAGWQPYGPPFVTHDHRIVQAMILPVGVDTAPGVNPPSDSASAVQAPRAQQQPVAAQAQAQATVPQAAPAQAQAAPPQRGQVPGQAPQGGLAAPAQGNPAIPGRG